MSNIQKDKITLINHAHETVKPLLIEYEEYFPCAAAIDLDGVIVPIHYFDGNENPLSDDLISKYEEILERKIEQKEIRAYAITYDVRVTKNSESLKTDAIAIKIKHIESEEIIVYFYAYRLIPQKTVEIIDSWGEIQP